MMNDTRQCLALGGLVLTIAAAVSMVLHLAAQPSVPGDLSRAAIVQVLAAGVILLEGEFVPDHHCGDETIRTAVLRPTAAAPAAVGVAQLGACIADASFPEVAFSIRNVEPGAKLTVLVDDTQLASATADPDGHVDGAARLTSTLE